MTNIETGVGSLKGLAEWILKQPVEFQMRPICTFDPDVADGEPWNGVIQDNGDYVIFSDAMTKAQYDAWRAKQSIQETQRAYKDWNRPEVLDAKERGLLP
jgi:hypothetical protein